MATQNYSDEQAQNYLRSIGYKDVSDPGEIAGAKAELAKKGIAGSSAPSGGTVSDAPDRIGGISQKPGVPNADGSPYDPTKAAAASNPIAASGVRRYTGAGVPGQSTADKATADYYASLNYAQPNEAKIRGDAMAAVQAQIDSINNVYANLLQNERVAGTDRMGRTRSVNARSGTMGSDFGNTNLDKTTDVNNANLKALEEERGYKISQILTKVSADVGERVQKGKEEAQKNTESHLSYLKSLGERAVQQVKDLSSAGFTMDQLTDDEYNHLLEATGYTPEQLKAEFTLNKPKATVLHSETVGNKYIQVTKDPITGKVTTDTIDLGFSVPQGYKSEKLANGQLVFYPEKIDPNKPFKDQVMTYGNVDPNYALGIRNKQLQNQKLEQDLNGTGEPADVIQDLKDAQDAIGSGADPDAVRRRFLETHPKKGDLYLKYTKSAY
jgi:hypothetical protein